TAWSPQDGSAGPTARAWGVHVAGSSRSPGRLGPSAPGEPAGPPVVSRTCAACMRGHGSATAGELRLLRAHVLAGLAADVGSSAPALDDLDRLVADRVDRVPVEDAALAGDKGAVDQLPHLRVER